MADAGDNLDWLDDLPGDEDLPLFHLRRERFPLPAKLKLEGYQIVVTIREVRFRFTAVSCRQHTAHVFLFEREVEGHWTQERVHTPETLLVIELIRQFAGFIYAVIKAEPTAPMLEFRTGVEDRSLRNFCRTATRYLARRLHATYESRTGRRDVAYVLTLPVTQPRESYA